MKKILILILLCCTNIIFASPRVVSSIYPLQQIANAIVGKPVGLICDSYLSPHQYNIKPTDTKMINNADIILWTGPALMPQLDKYIDRLAKDTVVITAKDLPDIRILKSSHSHGDKHKHSHSDKHKHSHGDKHKHSHSDKHKHSHGDKHKHSHGDKHKHSHGDKHKHSHGEHNNFDYDPHLWLSTENAKVIAKALTKELIKKDRNNKDIYSKNLQKFINELQETKSYISYNLANKSSPNYFVFHDAYAYFEQEFSLKHNGIITLHAGQTPKALHLKKLRKKFKKSSNLCLFSEPQFDSKIVKKLIIDTNIKIKSLDPIGYQKNKNIGYPKILKNIAETIINCRK